MKYLRHGSKGLEQPGVLDANGQARDISHLIADITPLTIAEAALPILEQEEIAKLPLVPDDTRIGACLSWVGNFYCIGLNYRKPDAPQGMDSSNKVVITSKASSALSGPHDTVLLPPGSKSTDWEVELGVVIGKESWRVSPEQAMSHVFGYCVVNDLCERDYMFEHGGQWIKGKSVPGYGPIGPWLVTRDEVSEPQNLPLWLKVNGVLMQASNTAEMITGVAQLVSHMSHYMKLLPGDLIATGTPPGIGMHRKPPVFLKAGDMLELGVDGLGMQSARVFNAE